MTPEGEIDQFLPDVWKRGRGPAADAANVFLNGTLVVRSTAPSSPPGTARVLTP